MNQFEEKILLSNNDAYHIVAFAEILYCKSQNSSTIFFLSNGKQICTSLSIGSLEERLAKHGFIRSHQSFVVNIQHVIRIHKHHNIELELTNQCIIPVSTRKKSVVMQFIGKMERFQD